MNGYDCTPEQIESASAFLHARGLTADIERLRVEGRPLFMTRADIVRLLAWYGALRYISARDHVGGTLEQPGAMVSLRDDAETKPQASAPAETP